MVSWALTGSRFDRSRGSWEKIIWVYQICCAYFFDRARHKNHIFLCFQLEEYNCGKNHRPKYLFYIWTGVIIALRSENKPQNGWWWIHISHRTTAGGADRRGNGTCGFLSLSNWVKEDVPLSAARANCSGHKNKTVRHLVCMCFYTIDRWKVMKVMLINWLLRLH